MYNKPEPLLPLSVHMKRHKAAKQKAKNRALALSFFAHLLGITIGLTVLTAWAFAVHNLFLL